MLPNNNYDMVTLLCVLMRLLNVQAICADKDASGRVLRSYGMMLDFYGMKLNERTGE